MHIMGGQNLGTLRRQCGRVLICLMGLALILIANTASALAQGNDAKWPDRPVRFIVPFPAGSASDIVARIVAQKLGAQLGQQFVIDNRSGASGLSLIHISEPTRLGMISYAVFCLKK